MVKLAEILFERTSGSRKKSEKFAHKVRDDVYPILLKQARFIYRMMKLGKKPSDPEVLNQMNYYMRQHVGENPIESVDTYGITLMIGYLLKNPETSTKAKRYFRSVVDNWLKTKV
jgi:hypothetical protein